MNKVLMHVCCAPCFITVYEDINENGMLIDGKREKVELTAYWYNPNIHPKVEYEKRKESFIKYCQDNGIKNVINDCYDLEGFTRDVVEQVGKDKKYNVRCKYCYYRRLEETFRYASENGYDIVSTTLTRSPFQNHDLINEVAQKLAEKYNVKYVYSDYRHTYYEGQKKAREKGLYMQKYCGCVFSFDSGKWNY